MSVKAPNFYGLVILKNTKTKIYVDTIRKNHETMINAIKEKIDNEKDIPCFIDEDTQLFSDSVASSHEALTPAIQHAENLGLEYLIDFTTFGLDTGMEPVPWAKVTSKGKAHTIHFVET
jgi:hypothetical protein